jgi:hypothetical protein
VGRHLEFSEMLLRERVLLGLGWWFRLEKISRDEREGMDMRRLIQALVASFVVALALPLAVVWQAGPASAATAAPGTITCTHITGTITFTPALHATGTSNTEVAKTRTTSTGCTVSTGKAPSKGVTTSSITTTSTNDSANACAGLATSRPVTEHAVWTHTPLIAPSTVKFSGLMVATEPVSGDAGFTLPNTGGTASVTGSYPGTDHGATSTATVYINMTAAQIFTACGTTAGVAKLTLDAGSATLK